MLTVIALDEDVGDGEEGVDGPLVLDEEPPLPQPQAARTTIATASILGRMKTQLRKGGAGSSTAERPALAAIFTRAAY